MSTDDNQSLNGSPAPFVRRPVTWGRPPATVFRAGPLPKGERLPPLPEPPATAPVRAPQPNIFSGSMIPRAAPTPALTPTPAPTPAPARPEAPVRPTVLSPSPEPDLEVRPLPPLPEIPEVRPVPQAAEPAPTIHAAPVVAPRVAASASRRPTGRMPLYAGAAAAVVAVVAVGGWMLTRSPAVEPAAVAPVVEASSTPAPATVGTAAVVEAVPVAEQPVIETSSTPAAASARSTPAAVSRPAPARTAAVQPAASTPAASGSNQTAAATPPPVVPPATVAAQPVIEIVPSAPAGPPPTTAERPPADPDAPIATRPQPLD